MTKKRKPFSPGDNFIHHYLGVHAGMSPSKKPQKYLYVPGAMAFLRERANTFLYPPILPFVLDNCKIDRFPKYINFFDAKKPAFDSWLANPVLSYKFIICHQLGFTEEEILKYIDIGPFKGTLTIKKIRNFFHYLWNVCEEDKKLVDQIMLNIKFPINIVRLYCLYLKDIIQIDTLLYHLTGKPLVEVFDNKMLNLALYHLDRFPTYFTGYNLDDAKSEIETALLLTKIVKNIR